MKINLSWINLTIILVGLICLGFGLYRTVPVKFNAKFFATLSPLLGMFVALAVVAFWKRGSGGIISGAEASITAGASYLPTMLGFFLTMGFATVVVDIYRAQIVDSLTGSHAYASSLSASFVLPSTSAVGREISHFWLTTPVMRPNLIFLFMSTSLLSVPLFYMRTMGMDFGMQWRLYLASVVSSLLLIPILQVFKFFGSFG